MCELEGGVSDALFPCRRGGGRQTPFWHSLSRQGERADPMTNTQPMNPARFLQQNFQAYRVTTTSCSTRSSALISRNIFAEHTKKSFFWNPRSLLPWKYMIFRPLSVRSDRVAPEAVIMIDNTRRLAFVQKFLEFDIDISIRAGTKYLIGHSDAMVGTAVANARCWEQLRENAYLM